MGYLGYVEITKLDHYPVPKVQNLSAIIGGSQKYTKLDLRHAYLQIVLDDEPKPYTTISTNRGVMNIRLNCLISLDMLYD